MPLRIALATCSTLPEPDPDDAPLRHELTQRGATAVPLPWDGVVNTSGFDLCVLRSTWNYYHAPERFLAWAERTATQTRLVNPLAVLRWNLHKRYLRELASDGVPIVPTAWLERGTQPDLAALLRERGWPDIVIKPAISAASFLTRRFAATDFDLIRAFVATELPNRDLMVQPYLRAVEHGGERALVWIAGHLTHAVAKQPRFAGADEQVLAATSPTPAEHAFAAQAVARWRDAITYARVDVMRADDGQLLLSELELIEPSLFFAQCPAACARFAEALLAVTE